MAGVRVLGLRAMASDEQGMNNLQKVTKGTKKTVEQEATEGTEISPDLRAMERGRSDFSRTVHTHRSGNSFRSTAGSISGWRWLRARSGSQKVTKGTKTVEQEATEGTEIS